MYHQSTLLNKKINTLAQQHTTLERDLAITEHGLLIVKNSWKELKTIFLESKAPTIVTTPSPQPATEPTEIAPELAALTPEPATDIPIPVDTIIASVVGDLGIVEVSEMVGGTTTAEGSKETRMVGTADEAAATEHHRTTEVMATISLAGVKTTTPSNALVEG